MMKPLFVTFGMAGFLLSSALVAQANSLQCPTVDACTLCADQCGGGWPNNEGSFQGTGNLTKVRGKDCTGTVGTVTKPGNTDIHLCCRPVASPPCPPPT